MDLTDLGWNPFFEAHFNEVGGPGLAPGRVVREQRELYWVYAEGGEFTARISGRMLYRAGSRSDYPAVGDWVAISPRPEEARATIHAVLPRKSRFCRKVAWRQTEEQVLAANIDTVLLVSALTGDFSPRRLERYLTLAWESGAKPVVLLNKIDLCPDVESRVREAEVVVLGAPIHAVSALKGEGLDSIRGYACRGQTVALLGSSGVGKSTLINSLLGAEILPTGEVREYDGRGRHVTSSRQLVILPTGGMVIDTPGMRELQMWADERSLEGSFGDVEELAGGCRFRDCQHKGEPGCAVKRALEEDRIGQDRFKSYMKLQREIVYLAVRKDQRARINEKRCKQIARWSRQRKQFNRRNM